MIAQLNPSAPPVAAGLTTLAARLAAVLGRVGWVEKRGRNDFHRYDYAMEADFLEEVRGKLAEAGVFVSTDVEDVQFHQSGAKDKNGAPKEICVVRTAHTFHCGETGESLRVTGAGCGEDSGDKGVYKAITGAMKYFLAKNFLIPTGDDPEKDEDKGAGQALPEARAFQTPPPSPPRMVDGIVGRPAPGTGLEDYVTKVDAKSGPKKGGGTYTRYAIYTKASGIFGSFNGAHADIADAARAQGRPVSIEYSANGRYKDILSISFVEGSKPAPAPSIDDETIPF